MKITDVTLTMFKWEGLPAALPKKHSVQPGSSSQIGLLTIVTDEGVNGHAFLGTSNRSAELDALSLLTYLKPVVMGQDPAGARAVARDNDLPPKQHHHAGYRRRGRGAVGYRRQGCRIAIYQMLGSYRESIPAYVSSPRLATVEDYAAEAAEMKAAGMGGV